MLVIEPTDVISTLREFPKDTLDWAGIVEIRVKKQTAKHLRTIGDYLPDIRKTRILC